MEKKFKPMNIKLSTYEELEFLRKELGLRALTHTIEFLIKEYKNKK
jgi:hypothetical protein